MIGSKMIGNPNIATKMFDFKEGALIGWLANAVREPAEKTRTSKLNIYVFILRLSIISDPIINIISRDVLHYLC